MTELIVALDQPDYDRAIAVVEKTADSVRWFKVGYEAFYGYGDRLIDALRERRASIFLDLKLHDIPNTVAAGVRSAARFEPALLTVHAAGGREMLAAAARARDEVNASGGKLKLLADAALGERSERDAAA